MRRSRAARASRVDRVYVFWTRWGVPLTLVLLIVSFSIASPVFFTYDNVINILQQRAVIALAAIGTTVIIIGGGIDLTMGAVVALTSILVAMPLAEWGWPLALAIPFALAAASVVGGINGVLTTKLNIPPLIATLGMLLAVRGFAFVVSGNKTIGVPESAFSFLGRGFVGPVPFSVIVIIIAYTVVTLIMSRTSFGVHTYAIGSNELSARLAGIRVGRHRFILYTLGGFFSGAAGLALNSRLGSGWAAHGTGYEFDIIAAILLGGASVFGGRGSLLRTLLGVMIVGVLTNGMVLLNINTFYQNIATGGVLIFALAMDQLGARRRDVGTRH